MKLQNNLIRLSIGVIFLILPWSNLYGSDNLQPIEINEENIGYFQTNTCEFNLFQVISKNLRNTSFELRSDPTSRVECHGKVNGLDLVDNVENLFWDKSKY